MALNGTTSALLTPALLLDRSRLVGNCEAMKARAEELRVRLRPHLKTAKCVEVARLAVPEGGSGITVATLRTARWFAERGHRDVLVATGLVPAKVPAAARLVRDGVRLQVLLEGARNTEAVAEAAAQQGVTLDAFLEVDCGQGRGGHRPDDPELLSAARVIESRPALRLSGVLTHAGHSYGARDAEARKVIAEAERAAAVEAKTRLEAASIACGEVSVGSTPTALAAQTLEGVTEMRPGVYTFFDRTQAALGVCAEDDLALSVLATVVSRGEGHVWIDAGTLALSSERLLGQACYGRVTTVDGSPLGVVDTLNQEHGRVVCEADARLEVGAQVRVWPNHACITAAMFDAYEIVDGDAHVGRWARLRG